MDINGWVYEWIIHDADISDWLYMRYYTEELPKIVPFIVKIPSFVFPTIVDNGVDLEAKFTSGQRYNRSIQLHAL